jgi:hypothetical protein
MPPTPVTSPWVPVPVAWEGVRVTDDGRRLRIFYVSLRVDRVDIRWGQDQLTITLSGMMNTDDAVAAVAVFRCAEIPLSRHVGQRTLIDGATGEQADMKRSRWLDPQLLHDTESSLDSVFEPTELLHPREFELIKHATGDKLVPVSELTEAERRQES